MTYDIQQLTAADYEEAIDFINMVFSVAHQPTDFPKLLPAYYKPTEEHMKCHQVIRINGKIRALVGIYPGEISVGGKILKAARIGAVSTHPSYSGQGLMQALMKHCMALISKEGYDIALLGGLRHRYLYYGFDKFGYKLVYTINKSNLKHTGINFDKVEIKPAAKENKELIQYYLGLHDRQKIHFLRSGEDFYDLCMNWKSKLYSICREGKPAGYLVTKNGDISEINTDDNELAFEAIIAFAQSGLSDKVSISVSPLDLNLSRKLGTISETANISGQSNWNIFNWEKVLPAYMSVKNSVTPLEDGSLVLGIKDYGNLFISVSKGSVTCEKTQEQAVIELEPTAAGRMLFGPLQPQFVKEIPQAAAILNSWCPLPLYLSSQDFA